MRDSVAPMPTGQSERATPAPNLTGGGGGRLTADSPAAVSLGPTQRLIDAAASLDPVARALLNLWMHSGFSDSTLAEMARVDEATIAARKLDIVEHLSDALGLPPHEVLAALRAIAPGLLPPAVPRSRPPAPPAPQHPPASPRVPPPPRLPWRARPFARVHAEWAAVAVLAVVAALILAGLSAGGSAGARHRDPVPSAIDSLRPPAGIPGNAGGEVAAVHAGGGLRITVTGLPVARGGYYEVWLYNSILDARPLGRLATRASRTLPLPGDARHFRWIDVSFQPPGYGSDSGQSVLRAANPAA